MRNWTRYVERRIILEKMWLLSARGEPIAPNGPESRTPDEAGVSRPQVDRAPAESPSIRLPTGQQIT
jgi:hypothetical protein